MTELETVTDPDTVHASFTDPAAARARAADLRAEIRDAPDEVGELATRGDLVDLLRVLGELDEALNEANAAVDRADIAGGRAQQHLARVRLAQVHQWRGEFAESTVLVTELLSAADRFGPVVEAFTHQHAGENDYDQGHWGDAHAHFARAFELRAELELPEAQESALALDAADRRSAAS